MADNTVLNVTTGGDSIRDIDRSGVKTQVMVLDAGGAAGESLVTPTNPLPTSINAVNFLFSTVNSSTTQLASNATFTGTPESALSQPSISLLMTSDQPMTLTVNQYIDAGGTQAVPPIVFNVSANAGFSGSFVLNGNYIRLTAKNVGTATTTTFSLNTAYGTIPSGDEQGRMPVSSADCINLLTTTMSAAGTTSSIDTKLFAAVVIQVSGVWQGQFMFEGSNDALVWDSVTALSRDNPGLQDIISSGGMYTVRPAGRYLRMNVSNITGTMAINALGRDDPGIAAADYLSFAMDRQNNMPLNVSLMNTKQTPDGALFLADGAGPYMMTGNTQIILDTLGYNSVTVNGLAGSGIITAEFSDALGGQWTRAQGLRNTSNSNLNPSINYQINWSAGVPDSLQVPCPGRYMRLTGTIFNAAGQASIYLRSANVTAVPTNVAALGGQVFVGEGSSVAQSATPVGGRSRTSIMTTAVNGTSVYHTMTSSGALIVDKHAVPELTWSYAAAASGIVNTTTAVTIKAAVASQRGNITALQVNAEALGAATEFAIRDGAGGTVLWRIKIPATGLAQQNFTDGASTLGR